MTLDLDAIASRNDRRVDRWCAAGGDLVSIQRSGDLEPSSGRLMRVDETEDGDAYVFEDGRVVWDEGSAVVVNLEPSAREDIDALIAEVRKLRRGR